MMYIKKTQIKVILCLGFLGSVSMWSLHPSQPCFSGCCFVVLRPNETQYTCPSQPWDLWQKVPLAACFLPLLPNRSPMQQERTTASWLMWSLLCTPIPLFEQMLHWFLACRGTSRFVFSSSHFSSQACLDPLCLILGTTTPRHRDPAYSTTQPAHLETQVQLYSSNKTWLTMEGSMAAEALL